MEKELDLSADQISLMWKVIDHLPDNLGDFHRDSFGMANLFIACGIGIAPLDDPHGPIQVVHPS